jgi:hypothetical protein
MKNVKLAYVPEWVNRIGPNSTFLFFSSSTLLHPLLKYLSPLSTPSHTFSPLPFPHSSPLPTLPKLLFPTPSATLHLFLILKSDPQIAALQREVNPPKIKDSPEK